MSRVIARLLLYPTLVWNVLICRVLRVWNPWDEIDTRLFLGGWPFRADVRRLRELGVRAVINTCEEYAGPVSAYEECGMIQLRLPTVDFTPPSLDDVRTAVGFIEEHLEKGQAVYVHCKAGRGRSATIALCWLMYAHQLSPDDAFKRLQGMRKQVSRGLAGRRVVQEFWEGLSEVR